MAAAVRWGAVCIDCAPDRFHEVVAFYRDLLGMTVAGRDERRTVLRDPAGQCLTIQAEDWYAPAMWPDDVAAETKPIHFALAASDLESAVALVVRAGGTDAPYQPHDRGAGDVRVMLDPAGHPFCLCALGMTASQVSSRQ